MPLHTVLFWSVDTFVQSVAGDQECRQTDVSSVSDPDPHGFALTFVGWIQIHILNDTWGQNWPTKIEKTIKIRNLKCWMFSLRAEGFSCSLDVFYQGLGASKLQFWITKILIFVSLNIFYNFCSSKPWIWVPYPHWPIMLDPDTDPHWNQCGSEITGRKFHFSAQRWRGQAPSPGYSQAEERGRDSSPAQALQGRDEGISRLPGCYRLLYMVL